MCREPTHVGVFLFSGSCLYELRKIEDEFYDSFCAEFHQTKSKVYPEKLLKDVMPGESEAEKLATAWGLFARDKLHGQGLSTPWKRVYVRLPEFGMLVASFAVLHFGARYPMIFGRDFNCHPNLWNMRLHVYVGNSVIASEDPQKRTELSKIQLDTINLVQDKILQAALPYMKPIVQTGYRF